MTTSIINQNEPYFQNFDLNPTINGLNQNGPVPNENRFRLTETFLNIDFDFKQQEYANNKLSKVSLFIVKIVSYIFERLSIKNTYVKELIKQHSYSSQMSKLCGKMNTKVGLADLKLSLNSVHLACIQSIFSQEIVDTSAAHWIYKSCLFKSDQIALHNLISHFENGRTDDFKALFQNLPIKLQNSLCQSICSAKGGIIDRAGAHQEILDHPELLCEIYDDSRQSILTQFIKLSLQFENDYRDLAILNHAKQLAQYDTEKYLSVLLGLSQKTKEELSLPTHLPVEQQLIQIEAIKINLESKVIDFRAKVKNIDHSIDPENIVYGSTVDILTERNILENLDAPITVALVGIEYAGLLKQGGLAEAIEGLSKAIMESHPDNKARLFFPKYNTLPIEILDRLVKTQEVYLDDESNEINVYKADVDGVECFFIEHETFNLADTNPSPYFGHSDEIVKKRFITFSSLAANVLYAMPGNDIIHLHDWHVAGVGLKLAKDHKTEWEEGTIPPVVFTFHNNTRCAQGRILGSPYNFDPIVKALQESRILENNGNLFVEMLNLADSITTVSETFSKETQLPELGEGVAFAVQNAAKVGKLTGILNGVNTQRWDPSTDPSLVNWLDVVTQEPTPLNFSPQSEDAYGQKIAAKQQLNQWIKKYLPDSDFQLDLQKPLLAYIGRLDSHQKGLDKFETAIESTLKNGGQFIIMGSQEDEQATAILNQLETKYGSSVLFLRDFKDDNGKFHFQEGDDERPGIGPVVRATTDFLFVPSRFEPCGLVQFESWLFGTQVIASRTGGLADTVITRDKSPDHFNGYLFDRNSSSNEGAYHQVSQAIKEWKSHDHMAKDQIIKRLMLEGRQYSWSSIEHGLSPVQKYRRVYEQAKQRIHLRKRSDSVFRFDIQDHLYKTIVPPSNVKIEPTVKKEEAYLAAYYLGSQNDRELEELYYTIPENVRQQLPPPHAKRIQFENYQNLGAVIDATGVNFTVNAPHAKKVTLKLFNQDRELIEQAPLVKQPNGQWNVHINECQVGRLYQYEINNEIKLDPYGLSHVHNEDPVLAPYSVVCDRNNFAWTDAPWIDKRIKKSGSSQPMNIYEMHPTAWKRKENGQPFNFRELAHELTEHVKKSGFTHVELMGILEHAFEGSMGYQVTGFFAPNSRLGTIDDFKYLINYLHENNIGVILDWVPAHFSKNSYALDRFDGTKQFEPSFWDFLFSKRRFYQWGTSFFDYSKRDVREFLISNAVYWLNDMHIDGLRVDAVRCILDSENQHFAKLFLRELNAIVHTHCKGSITIAEDYSGAQGLSEPAYKEGLGFDFKWNVAWMHHTLDYFSAKPSSREHAYKKLIKSIEDDKAHKMILALSHDEVKESAKTLLNKVQGISREESYANVRSMLSFMMCVPGKKLNFMGNELGADVVWTDYLGRSHGLMDSNLNHEELAQQTYQMCVELNTLYLTQPAFWQNDDNANDLKWIESKDPNGKIIAYRRKDANGEAITCFHNVAGNETVEYVVPVVEAVNPNEIFNSDQIHYGGAGRINSAIELVYQDNKVVSYKVKIPPLSTVIIQE
ncbi:MAG: glycogen/starch synthase [Candidatus Protochlamydia sp.]|nr:glycogen/starch synthase [Candidatus Protochlamydia sp.]